jgi:hypothetical protein
VVPLCGIAQDFVALNLAGRFSPKGSNATNINKQIVLANATLFVCGGGESYFEPYLAHFNKLMEAYQASEEEK